MIWILPVVCVYYIITMFIIIIMSSWIKDLFFLLFWISFIFIILNRHSRIQIYMNKNYEQDAFVCYREEKQRVLYVSDLSFVFCVFCVFVGTNVSSHIIIIYTLFVNLLLMTLASNKHQLVDDDGCIIIKIIKI